MSVACYYIPAEAIRTCAEWSTGDRRKNNDNDDDDDDNDVDNKPCGSRLVDVNRPTSIYKFLIRIHASINTYICMWVYIIIITMYSAWPEVLNFFWEEKSWVVVWSMVWPDFRSLSGQMSHVVSHGRVGTVRGNYLEDAVRRAKD